MIQYKRGKVNIKQLKEALSKTNNFILINLLDLSTIQRKHLTNY